MHLYCNSIDFALLHAGTTYNIQICDDHNNSGQQHLEGSSNPAARLSIRGRRAASSSQDTRRRWKLKTVCRGPLNY